MAEVKLGQRVATLQPGEAGYAESLARPETLIDPRLYRAVWFASELETEFVTKGISDCDLCGKIQSVISKIKLALSARDIWLQHADPKKSMWKCPAY